VRLADPRPGGLRGSGHCGRNDRQSLRGRPRGRHLRGLIGAMSLNEHNLLVVDDDDAFIDEAKRLFDGRLPVERSLDGALTAIDGGQLRMVLLGPSFASEQAMGSIRAIHNADPALILILVAEEVTAELL